MGKNKMKTKKAASKRLKVTGSGKLMRRQTGQGHLLSKKSSHRKRRLSGNKKVASGDAKHVADLLPYE
ncbi:MAG: 50S ribosomal protein L35 [Armatimonadetes bacterium]|nr:50S ribosomal protein L35 [Armatimonadota bacterium]